MPALLEPGRRPPGPNQLIPAHVGEGRFLCLLHASGHTLTLTHPRYTQLHSPLAHHPALLLPAPSTALSAPAELPEGPGPKGQPFKFPLHLSSLAEDTRCPAPWCWGAGPLAFLKGRGRQGCKNQERTALLGEDVLLHQLCWAAGDTMQEKKKHDCCSKLDFL